MNTDALYAALGIGAILAVCWAVALYVMLHDHLRRINAALIEIHLHLIDDDLDEWTLTVEDKEALMQERVGE